jgi:outer membrane immunogenic protein
MKCVVACVAAGILALTAGQAASEGLPPPGRIAAPVQPPGWNGFYLGAGIGAGILSQSLSGVHSWTTTECEYIKKKCPWWWPVIKSKCTQVERSEAFSGSDTGDVGVFGTVTVGFDHMLGSRWVAGVFADYDFGSNLSVGVSFPGYNGSLNHDSSWAVGGRLGYLVTPSTLVFAAGGYTQAELGVSNLGSATFEGYFVGGGVETFLLPNWTLRLEYRYSDFGAENILVDLEPSIHSARAVVTYRFGH